MAIQDPSNWLDQVKEDAEKLTKRRLEDDGFESHVERQAEINAAEEAVAKRAGNAREAEVVSVNPTEQTDVTKTQKAPVVA